MPTFKLTQVIKKPVEEVFNTVIDVANFPKWNPVHPSARKISQGETGEGTEFEIEVKGFGKVPQTLREFSKNKQVMIASNMKMLGGGHRFIFTAQGNETRIEHELIMDPKGIFKLMIPIMKMMGGKNLKKAADSLQKYLETK